MILDKNRNTSPRLARGKAGVMAAAAAMVAVLGVMAAPRLVLANQNSNTNSGALPSPETEQTTSETPDRITFASKAEPGTHHLALASGSATSDISADANSAGDDESSPKKKTKREDSEDGADRALPPVKPVPPIAPSSYVPGASKDKKEDRSLERRLDRLESLVEQLVARDKRPQGGIARNDFRFDMKMPNFDWKSAKLSEEDAERFREFERQRVGEIGRLQAELAKRALEDAMKGNRLYFQENTNSFDAAKRALEMKRDALDSQRDALQEQIDALERQMDRLEEQRDKLKDLQESKAEKNARKHKETKRFEFHSERPEKPERPERPEKPERPERVERP